MAARGHVFRVLLVRLSLMIPITAYMRRNQAIDCDAATTTVVVLHYYCSLLQGDSRVFNMFVWCVGVCMSGVGLGGL